MRIYLVDKMGFIIYLEKIVKCQVEKEQVELDFSLWQGYIDGRNEKTLPVQLQQNFRSKASPSFKETSRASKDCRCKVSTSPKSLFSFSSEILAVAQGWGPIMIVCHLLDSIIFFIIHIGFNSSWSARLSVVASSFFVS